MPPVDLYSPGEIARAAGVSQAQVVAALGGVKSYVRHADAVRLGRALAASVRATATPPGGRLFSLFSDRASSQGSTGVPMALSSTLHAGLFALAIFLSTVNLAPRAAAFRADDRPADPMRLVFLPTPGPGGGGGGGGLEQPAPPPKALREGHHAISSPLPARREPTPIIPTPAPPEPESTPLLRSEPLPAIVAPIVMAPADSRTRIGVFERTDVEADIHGAGKGGGAGTGTGTGLGQGDGNGIGPGTGGGTGGGPYRAGSGIEAPRLLREVKADYTEDARRRGLSGDVVLEIVVRRDGTVGDVKMLKGLGADLDQRAAQAVRQWRFSPAVRQGAPVDVIVEVAVEFKLR